MKCVIQWSLRRAKDPERERGRRIERLLREAQNCPYYRGRVRWPGLEAIRDPEAALRSYPEVPLADFLRNPGAFSPEGSTTGEGERVRHRSGTNVANGARWGRVLLVGGSGYGNSEDVCALRHGWGEEWRQFRPDTLAGPVSRLCQAALAVQSGRLEVPRLERAVVAFTGLREGLLCASDRELLWRSFRVPVFEQFQGFAGEPLARECEAQEGLHIERANAWFETSASGELLFTSLDDSCYVLLRLQTGLKAAISEGDCACGEAGARLVGLSAMRRMRNYAEGVDPALPTPSGAPLAAYVRGERLPVPG